MRAYERFNVNTHTDIIKMEIEFQKDMINHDKKFFRDITIFTIIYIVMMLMFEIVGSQMNFMMVFSISLYVCTIHRILFVNVPKHRQRKEDVIYLERLLKLKTKLKDIAI
ncbi:MAG: hypothetical protein ACRC18_06930 [Cetobacterium sp.]